MISPAQEPPEVVSLKREPSPQVLCYASGLLAHIFVILLVRICLKLCVFVHTSSYQRGCPGQRCHFNIEQRNKRFDSGVFREMINEEGTYTYISEWP